jgi:beta-phosphoglucomutase family hydrolase
VDNVSDTLRTTPAESPEGEFVHPDYASFEGLVFDCDGTLADTMPAHYIAWRQTMQRYGIAFEEDRFYALGGVPAPRIVGMLAQEQGKALTPEQVVAIAEEKERAFEDHLHGIGAVEPVVAVARAFYGRVPMAVATGGYRHIVERSLELIHIRHLFNAIVSHEDVVNPKPAPDTYLVAAERLGVRPARCCAFEDTDLGIRAARDAGMTVVDIRRLCAAGR